MNNYINKVIGDLKYKFNTTDPFKLVDCLDITLIDTPLGEVWGMYKYIKRNKTIFLNSELSYHEKRFVLAHEIGHAILHTKSSCFFSNSFNNNLKKEYQANMFAANLLIDIDDADTFYLKEFSIDQLASYYNVTTDLIKFRFKENTKNIC